MISIELLALVNKYKKRSAITSDNHWLWLGSRHKRTRHGLVGVNGKLVIIHRFIFCLVNNLDYNDSSFYACHQVSCNIPYCWNPDHIYKGNQSTNILDTVKAGNHNESRKTHCPRGHSYAIYGVRTKLGWRRCSECRKIYNKNRPKKIKRINNA